MGLSKKSGFILAFPAANQNVRADLRALERAGMLSMFCTTIAWRRAWHFSGLLPHRIRDELQRRVIGDIDKGHIKCFPRRELVRLIAERLGPSSLTQHETGWASVDSVSRDFDDRVARCIRMGKVGASAIYAYEYAALRAFEAAGKIGMRRFYELPIGYWRAGLKVMSEERERNPEWAATMQILRDSTEKQERKDSEVRAADHIIVPSDFVRQTLREHPAVTATVDVIPYGAPRPSPSALAGRPPSPKLRLLYVGQLTQLKGISYLFAAMRRVKDVATLTLIGSKPAIECAALDVELARHDWLGTLPHHRVLDIMARHDLLVFPSLFDGFGLVVLEAMSQGLPAITTPNAGSSMAVEDGKDGHIVPIRDPDAIVDRVIQLAEDRERLAAMSMAALRKAELMSWSAREKTFIYTLCNRLGADAA